MAEYEIPAFIADKSFRVDGRLFLDIPGDETVYALWIGTNDLGNGAFLTNSQIKGKTLKDYVDCVFDSLDKLYQSGGRYFVLMNVVPLDLAPYVSCPHSIIVDQC